MESDPDVFDVELLMAVRRGDDAAFGQLYDRHARAVLAYAWNRLEDRRAAEDVMQETFVVAWSKQAQARVIDESLLPWLLTICRNHVRNALRRRTRERTVPLTADVPAPEHSMEVLAWLRRELQQLTDVDRQLCELCLVRGLSYREAAQLTELTQTTVGKRLQRARARLRTALGETN